MRKKIFCIFVIMLLTASAVIIATADVNDKNDNANITTFQIGPPNDFTLTAISGGIPGWTELFKLEITNDGKSNYYWMYPEDRATQNWTLKNQFNLSADQMDELWDEIIANDFFNMNSLYEDPECLDGSYALLTIIGESTNYTVKTQNIIVKPFNAIMRKINSLTPGDSDLFYNAIIYEELNQPPGKPDRPSGLTSGKPGTSYTYETSGTEPEYDDMWYLFDWGDVTDSGWIGPYKAGQIASASHTWSKKGTYQVKVKAKDYLDEEGPWSDPLSISMPRDRQINNLFPRLLYNIFEKFRLFRNFIVLPDISYVAFEPSIETRNYVYSIPSFETSEKGSYPLFITTADGKCTSVKIVECIITVEIYIEIFGNGSKDFADDVESGIEDIWKFDPDTGNIWKITCAEENNPCQYEHPGCQVQFDAIVIKRATTADPTPGYHQVEILDINECPDKKHTSSCGDKYPPDGKTIGTGKWDSADTAEVIAHEAGHLMGLDEGYNPNTGLPLDGYGNNIMGTTKAGAKPSKAQVEEIVHNGGVWCPCNCCTH